MWRLNDARAVGDWCLKARRQAGLSQRELIERLAVAGIQRSQSEISRLERGAAGEREYRNATLLRAIAVATGVLLEPFADDIAIALLHE